MWTLDSGFPQRTVFSSTIVHSFVARIPLRGIERTRDEQNKTRTRVSGRRTKDAAEE